LRIDSHQVAANQRTSGISTVDRRIILQDFITVKTRLPPLDISFFHTFPSCNAFQIETHCSMAQHYDPQSYGGFKEHETV